MSHLSVRQVYVHFGLSIYKVTRGNGQKMVLWSNFWAITGVAREGKIKGQTIEKLLWRHLWMASLYKCHMLRVNKKSFLKMPQERAYLGKRQNGIFLSAIGRNVKNWKSVKQEIRFHGVNFLFNTCWQISFQGGRGNTKIF